MHAAAIDVIKLWSQCMHMFRYSLLFVASGFFLVFLCMDLCSDLFYLWYFEQRIFVYMRVWTYLKHLFTANVCSFNAKMCPQRLLVYFLWFHLDWVHYLNVVKVMWYIFLRLSVIFLSFSLAKIWNCSL